MNRLYWFDAETLRWSLVMESLIDHEIMRESAWRLQTSTFGVVGYSKICIKAIPTDYTYWTEYTRYEGGSKRANALEDNVPKSIRLMEMLQ